MSKADEYSKEIKILANRAAKDALGEILKHNLPPLPHLFHEYFYQISQKLNIDFPGVDAPSKNENFKPKPEKKSGGGKLEELKISKKALDEISSLAIEFAALNSPADSNLADVLSEILDDINLAGVPEDYVEVLERMRTIMEQNRKKTSIQASREKNIAIANVKNELNKTKDLVIRQDLQLEKIKEMMNTSLMIMDMQEDEVYLSDLSDFGNLDKLQSILKTRLLQGDSSHDLFLSNIYSNLHRVLSRHKDVWSSVQSESKKASTLEERVQLMVLSSAKSLESELKVSSELRGISQTLVTALEQDEVEGKNLTHDLKDFKKQLTEAKTADQLMSIRKQLVSKMDEIIESSKKIGQKSAEMNKNLQKLWKRLEKQDPQKLIASHSKSNLDELTGLKMRISFHSYLKDIFNEWEEKDKGGSVILVDIDHMSNYNQIHSFDRGDQVIKSYSEIVAESFPKKSHVFRHGGEEFSIIAPVSNMDKLKTISHDILKFFKSTKGKNLNSPSCCIGISIYTPQDTPKSLLKRALSSLKSAKQKGTCRLEIDQ